MLAQKAYCAPAHRSSVELNDRVAAAHRGAAAAFFLTGRGQFWGSAFHLEHFITAVRTAADRASPSTNTTVVLADVGAAPYNTVGGDISHVLTYLKNWPASSGAVCARRPPSNPHE